MHREARNLINESQASQTSYNELFLNAFAFSFNLLLIASRLIPPRRLSRLTIATACSHDVIFRNCFLDRDPLIIYFNDFKVHRPLCVTQFEFYCFVCRRCTLVLAVKVN